jgi:hypothetical protein
MVDKLNLQMKVRMYIPLKPMTMINALNEFNQC